MISLSYNPTISSLTRSGSDPGFISWSARFYNRPRNELTAVFLGSCRIYRRPLRLARSRVARGLRAFPFASDSTGWLSAPRKSVSIAARTAPDPRVRPGPIRVFRVPARERFRRKARGGRRETSLAGSAGARYRRTRRGVLVVGRTTATRLHATAPGRSPDFR